MLQFSPQRRRALKAFVLPQMTPIFPDIRKNLRSSAKSADKTPIPPLCASVPLWQKFVFIRVHSWLTPNSALRTPNSALQNVTFPRQTPFFSALDCGLEAVD